MTRHHIGLVLQAAGQVTQKASTDALGRVAATRMLEIILFCLVGAAYPQLT